MKKVQITIDDEFYYELMKLIVEKRIKSMPALIKILLERWKNEKKLKSF